MKHYVSELWAKKSKEYIGTICGEPIFGWGMRFYKDAECKNLSSIDPYHYIMKDKVMILGGVPVLAHVIK